MEESFWTSSACEVLLNGGAGSRLKYLHTVWQPVRGRYLDEEELENLLFEEEDVDYKNFKVVLKPRHQEFYNSKFAMIRFLYTFTAADGMSTPGVMPPPDIEGKARARCVYSLRDGARAMPATQYLFIDGKQIGT